MRPLALVLLLLGFAPAEHKPNVLLIVTDDQGYGDLGLHGNKEIRTPHLDAFAATGVRLDHFYVSPVCSPTRSSLLTGRYNYRTGVVDTFLGRSMMHPDEITLAQMLAPAGYRTGIFGKWHLGDNYPLRPQDHGFQECLTIRGGGIGQPSDPPGGDHYADATMYHNGKAFKSKGYCTDVFTDGTLQFIEKNQDAPFFAYVAFNAPHTPLETPEGYLKPYLDAHVPETTAKLYAMVSNIDDNVGRLLKKLDDLKLADRTIVVFMSDNGPQELRYNAGLRGLKGTCFEGGIRVPCLIRWPGHYKAGLDVRAPFAHIDVVPTLLESTAVERPKVDLDGISIAPWLEGRTAETPPRTLFFQWHRGDVPERLRACAARSGEWKAVWTVPTKKPFLFHITDDPTEDRDVAAEHPEVLAEFTRAYETWFSHMSESRHFEPPRIVLGTPHEDPAVLTRQDWRGPAAGWTPDSIGHWLVEFPADVTLNVTLRFKAPGTPCRLTYACGETTVEAQVAPGAATLTLKNVAHRIGKAELIVSIAAGKPYGPDYVEVERASP